MDPEELQRLRQREEDVKKLYDFVAEQVLAGLFKSEIIDKLIELGIDKYTAFDLVGEMEWRMKNLLKKTVMIVMEESEERAHLTKELEIAGYGVVQTNNEKRAISFLREVVPDLIMTDSQLSDVSGHELIKKIRKNPIGRKKPIFVFGERKLMKDSFAVFGLIEFVIRPYAVDDIIGKVKRILFLPKTI